MKPKRSNKLKNHMVDISVIIVNYNTCKITCECLNSIFNHTQGVDFEVIVVDNNSTKDNSKHVLKDHSGIIFVQSNTNLGFGKANNLGYEKSTGRYILFLNSDTYLLNNALKIFVDEFDNMPKEIACIGAQLLAPDGTNNNSYGELPSFSKAAKSVAGLYLHPLGIHFKKKSEVVAQIDKPFEVPYVMGADLCLRREAIEQEGLFDPEFFMYYEESEMQYRYQQAGWKSMIVPGPKIVHLECVSTNGGVKQHYSYANRKMFLQGQFLYFRKRYNYPIYLLYRIMFLFSFPLYLRSYYTMKERVKLICRLFSSTRMSKQ